MELIAAALAERLENHRPLGVFSAVVRHQDLDFGDHVLVDIGDLGAGVAGIDQVGAVQHVCHGAVGLRAVGGIGAHRAVVGADHLVVKAGPLTQAVGQRHSGHDLQQFARVAADDREYLQSFSVIDGRADFGVVGDDNVGARLNFDGLGHLADLESDVGQGLAVALGEDNARLIPRLETRSLDRSP